jgi:uncharacterized protein (TIGR03663 family)
MDKRQPLIPIIILIIAAVMRLAFLDIKPPHFDEGINGWFCDQMAIHGYYKYDPSNYHGPLHFYVLFLFLETFGRNLWALRLPVVIVGTLTVGLLLGFRRYLGKPIAYIAALGMALSPGFTFYQRYSIHETWLAFFLILTYWGALGIFTRTSPKSIYALVLGITGMILTKETYVIHVIAFLMALPALFLKLESPLPEPKSTADDPRTTKAVSAHANVPDSDDFLASTRPATPWNHLGLALLIGIFFILFFYSGTFLHWQGVRDLFKTFSFWTHTGMQGNGHEKLDFNLFQFHSWAVNWYWIHLLLRYEWLPFIGVLFSVPTWLAGNRHLRYLALYASATLIAYSVINYKTPWCMISITWPYLILGAAFIEMIWKSVPKRSTVLWTLTALYLTGDLIIFDLWHGFGHLKTFWILSLIGLILFLGGSYLGTRRRYKQALLALTLTLLVVRIIALAFHRLPMFPVSFDIVFFACLGALCSFTWLCSSRVFTVILALIILTFTTSKAIHLNFFQFDNPKEPYVYVQTFRDYQKLVNPILEKIRQKPELKDTLRGLILLNSYYPIPWVLGDIRDIGYYNDDKSWPQNLDADFIVIPANQSGKLDQHLHDHYMVVQFNLREGMEACKAYFRYNTFHDVRMQGIECRM